MVGWIAYFLLAILCSRFKLHASKEEVLEGRVVDGEFANINHYPHAVFLEIRTPDGSTHICGSSVVNQHFLLTAAHCFSAGRRWRYDLIVAFAGHEDLEKTAIVRTARMPIIHEEYDSEVVENDIALVYLPHQLPLGKNVKRIIINKSFPTKHTQGSLAGWGIINDITNEQTMLLKAVTQTVKNKKVCSRVVTGPGTLCAGSMRASDPRPAEGDSGSGLIIHNYQLIGLLSYKLPSMPALPVYTNVSYYYNWIRFNIKRKCLKN